MIVFVVAPVTNGGELTSEARMASWSRMTVVVPVSVAVLCLYVLLFCGRTRGRTADMKVVSSMAFETEKGRWCGPTATGVHGLACICILQLAPAVQSVAAPLFPRLPTCFASWSCV